MGTDSARGIVVWFTGLPSSGKSTLAAHVAERVRASGRACFVLDGDAVRAALVPPPGYTPDARDAFYATLAGLAALLAAQGAVVLVPATAHRADYRARARALARRFAEVYVRTDAAACALRDAKGLYAAARAGKASGVPGVDVDYEPPESPDVVASGGHDLEAVAAIVQLIDAPL